MILLFQYILCYFLSKRRPTAGGYSGISIHPMLFFIAQRTSTSAYTLQRFQYILCYFLSKTNHPVLHISFISIHPMLFFILLSPPRLLPNPYFNTSYVIFYQMSVFDELNSLNDFNTSYVIFYLITCPSSQNCASISIHHMLFFIVYPSCSYEILKDFNTSYVIFYLNTVWSGILEI